MASEFVTSSPHFAEPVRLSSAQLIAHLRDSRYLPEASIHPTKRQYPFLNIEFHDRAGFSILCFSNYSSIGRLATSTSRLSPPSVLVCLGGQVIEKWPKELFLTAALAKRIVAEFLRSGKPSRDVRWVRLDRFERETVHAGGRGLTRLWQRLQREPSFPFA